MTLVKHFALLALILGVSTCFAQGASFDSLKEEVFLEKILANKEFCVKDYDGNKIFLNEENIYPTGEGIFLSLNNAGDFIAVPKLLSDQSGCFIEASSGITHSDSFEIFNNCPYCGRKYYVVCRNKECPGKPE